MTIADVFFTPTQIVMNVVGKQEGMTVRLPRDITIAALERHLRELSDLLD